MNETFKQQMEDLEQKLSLLSDSNLPTANIIVTGITGTGKSTLVNAVFGTELARTGIGRPVTEYIHEYKDDDFPVCIWDTIGLELNIEKNRESIQSIKNTIAKMAETEDPLNRIHAIWYCINSGSSRIQKAELDFIKELHSMEVPFIIVLTQCYKSIKDISAFEEQIKEIIQQEEMSDISIVKVLAKGIDVEIGDDVMTKPAFGLDELVDGTLRQLPDFIKNGFIAAQRVNKNQKREQCEVIIYEFAKAAQEGFWYHVPLVNIFTTDEKIMKMFKKIGQIYNTVLSKESLNKVIKESDVSFENSFWGLLAPVDLVGYKDKVRRLLKGKKKDGFIVEVEDIAENHRASRMVAFYGYTFIDAIEELWEKFTEQQLKDVNMVVENLIRIINRKLKELKNKGKR